MTRRLIQAVTLAAVVALLAAGATLAAAGGQGTVTITTHDHNVLLFSTPATTCTGAQGTLTAIAANEVFHVTFFTASDEFWVTGTDEGTFTFTPNDLHGVSGGGHFAAWFGESFNKKNDVQHSTNTFNLTASDGSHLVVHETFHLSTDASGDVTVNFDKMDLHMTCG